MKKTALVVGLIVICQLVIGFKINYAPTEEQLIFGLERLSLFGGGEIMLWLLRISSLFFLLLALEIFSKKIENKKISSFFEVVLLASPLFFTTWYLHPIDALKMGTILIGLGCIKIYKNWINISTLTVLLVIICFFQFGKDLSLMQKISLKQAQGDIGIRFVREDSLKEKIDIPLLIRRLAYNKYYMQVKTLLNESVNFFDIETLFYQEVHPMEQKSIVMFVWPELLLFLFGLYVIKKYKENKFLLILGFLAFVNYMFSGGSLYKRFLILSLLIALIISIALDKLIELNNKKYWASNVFLVLTVFLSVYGITVNYYDLFKRADYWYDNRPMAYSYIFNTLKDLNIPEGNKVIVTTLFGETKKYCNFYIKNCNDNFIFNSFSLKDEEPKDGIIYVGFAGEFVGEDFKNNILDWERRINEKGLKIIKHWHIRDNIAYRYGNELVIASKDEI